MYEPYHKIVTLTSEEVNRDRSKAYKYLDLSSIFNEDGKMKKLVEFIKTIPLKKNHLKSLDSKLEEYEKKKVKVLFSIIEKTEFDIKTIEKYLGGRDKLIEVICNSYVHEYPNMLGHLTRTFTVSDLNKIQHFASYKKDILSSSGKFFLYAKSTRISKSISRLEDEFDSEIFSMKYRKYKKTVFRNYEIKNNIIYIDKKVILDDSFVIKTLQNYKIEISLENLSVIKFSK